MNGLQYVMQLSGPPRKPMGLLGIFDPIAAHPLMMLLGIGTGVFLAHRRHRRRR